MGNQVNKTITGENPNETMPTLDELADFKSKWSKINAKKLRDFPNCNFRLKGEKCGKFDCTTLNDAYGKNTLACNAKLFRGNIAWHMKDSKSEDQLQMYLRNTNMHLNELEEITECIVEEFKPEPEIEDLADISNEPK